MMPRMLMPICGRGRQLLAGLGVALLAGCGGGDSPIGTVTPPPVIAPPPVVTPAPPIPAVFASVAQGLDANPPKANGQNSARTAPVTAFENILWTSDVHSPASDVLKYYEARMARVATEIQEPVTTGFRVWSMYNHGFIIKTPTATFAFDLVDGKTDWVGPAWTGKIADEILFRIDALMVSHEHVDHWNLSERIPQTIKIRNGAVLYPGGGQQRVSTTHLVVNSTVVRVKDLTITAHAGLHSVANMVYEVVTGDGYRIVHTGDNQTSVALPALTGVDVLLLNGWVNESGATSNLVGMQRSLEKLRPAVMIPGHFAEISRPIDAWYRFTHGLSVASDPQQRSKVVVMTWGERMDFTQSACVAGLVRVYEACLAP